MESTEIIEKGRKRTRKRLTALERLHQDCNHPVPEAYDANALADGIHDGMHQEQPDECKSAADMAASATNAEGGARVSAAAFNRQRTGTPELAVRTRVAVGHPDLQQQPATVFQSVLASLRANPYSYLGQAGFHGTFSGTDSPADAPGNHVQVRGFDAAGSAGGYRGMQPVDIAPRGDDGYSQHRNSATASNGSHVLSNPTSHAVPGKASRLDIMKEALFGA
jgi:hypothetical protein